MMFVFFGILFLLPHVPNVNAKTMSLLLFNLTNIWLMLLTWVIYKTEKIYWYTGLSYEEAAKASSEMRKKYAIRHFLRFAIFTAGYGLYSVISYLDDIHIGFDIVIEIVCIVTAVVSTVNIKLKSD